ncbi:MAG TPA: EAL domain-containing protein [Ilumatobacter sp.]|nr:EAL domain-containing protein [Ilumatobacter sp.]
MRGLAVGHTARGGDEWGAADRMWAIVGARAALYVVAGVIPLLLVDVHHPTVAVVVCAGAALVQPLLIPISRRVHYQLAQSIFDTSIVIALAVIAPDLWYTSLVLIAAGSTMLAATMRPDVHLVLIGLLLSGVLVAGSLIGPMGWFPSIAIGVAVLTVLTQHGRASRRKIQQTDDRLEQAMAAARSIAQTVDLATGRVLEVTGDVRRVTGWDEATWMSVPLTSLAHAEDAAELIQDLELLEQHGELDRITRYYDPTGECRWLRQSGRFEIDHRGRGVLRGMVTDATALHTISNALHEQARLDRTTGLPNRQRLEEDLDLQAVGQEPFAYLVVDIREFKSINNTVGHHIGDLVLTMMATRLDQLAGAGQRVYRLSADQFAMVLNGITDGDEAVQFADSVALDCRRPYSVGRVALVAPVHIGVALSAANTAPSHTIRQADVALDAAKSRNREVVLFSSDMQRYTLDNLMLSAAVDQGLDRNEFVLFFQPQIDLHTGRIVGAEGLVRWLHPDRGQLSPVDFLEALRLSASFDRFTVSMVRQAVQAAEASRSTAEPVHYSVNVEMRSLLSRGFSERVIAVLGQHDIGHHRVVLEVTETELAHELADDSTVDPIAELHRLRAAGYEISIDDFGTGASSLARLSVLPADEVKIDRQFISALFSSERANVLVDSIIHLADNLGMRVVAEGIESPDHVAHLARAGCSIGQGFLFSKAVPLPELLGSIHRVYAVSYSPADARPAGSSVTPLRPKTSSRSTVA